MDNKPLYLLVENSDLPYLESTVQSNIARGYVPQQLVVIPAVPGATSRNRFVVPMILKETDGPTDTNA